MWSGLWDRAHGTDQAQRSIAEWGEQLPLTTRFTFQAEPRCTYTFNQMASMVPSCYHHEPDWQATRLIYIAKELGFDAIRTITVHEQPA